MAADRVTRHGLDPCYKEDATGVAAERDRAIEQRENANAATLRAEAERDRYRQIGDRMQSEASRLAAWVRGENLEMHWEAYLALSAVERCVRDWTAARSAPDPSNQKEVGG